MGEGRWICVRQRAGPLIKECRALRPSYSRTDTPDVRREKAEIKRFLALYFEASMSGEAMPDIDGGQFFEEYGDETA